MTAPDDKTEREHCEDAARRFFDYQYEEDGSLYGLPNVLLSERAAAKAESEAKYSALLTSWAELKEERRRLQVECDSHRMEREGRREIIEIQQAELSRLKARVLELELVWAYYERLHDGHSEAVFKLCAPPDHFIDLDAEVKNG